MTFGSLFSGIGGIDIGLERSGLQPLWQCEINKFCRELLKKRWPNVKLYGDIRDIDEKTPRPNVLCGGFPCQDISTANTKGKGLDGSKSGLWFEFYRVIRLLRPRYVLVENVANLVNKGLDRILEGLAQIGYDAEWQVLSAAQFGAWHLRRRIFIVAYTNSVDGEISGEAEFDLEGIDNGVQTGWNQSSGSSQRCGPTITPTDPAELQRNGRHNNTGLSAQSEEISEFGDGGGENATTNSKRNSARLEKHRCGGQERQCSDISESTNLRQNNGTARSARLRTVREDVVSPDDTRHTKRRPVKVFPEQFASERYSWWEAKPGICRVYDGIPNRVDRLKSLGNAVVPQVAEYLGKLILNHSRREVESSGQGAHSHEHN